MEKVKVDKQKALKIIRKNREEHREIFLEACDGYKQKCIELLEQHLSEIKAGKKLIVNISLPTPQDNTKEYDRAIKMLEMSVDKVVEMDEQAFAQYIMDDWHWKRQFLVSNSMYSQKAAATYTQSYGG